MRRILFALLFALAPLAAEAANCSSNPFTLTNGQQADATQVMSNFNNLLNCANNNLAHSGANSDITSLSALSTPLSVSQGGTGAATLTAHGALIGNGTGAPSFLVPGSTGNLAVSNGTDWAATLTLNGAYTFSGNNTFSGTDSFQKQTSGTIAAPAFAATTTLDFSTSNFFTV